MNPKNEIISELSSLAPSLIPLRGVQVFFVPDGYFEHFPKSVNEVLKTQLLVDKVSEPSMEVPVGYFDSFASQLISKIRQESVADELKEISPALSDISRKNVFQVPDNYFENFSRLILTQTAPAKVIRANFRSVARYAVAAVITGLLGLGIFTWSGNNQDSVTPASASVIKQGLQIAGTESFDEVMSTITADEIQKFLQQSGEDIDAALVAASLEGTELPDPIEYIIDDNTLNNYLDNLNINDLN